MPHVQLFTFGKNLPSQQYAVDITDKCSKNLADRIWVSLSTTGNASGVRYHPSAAWRACRNLARRGNANDDRCRRIRLAGLGAGPQTVYCVQVLFVQRRSLEAIVQDVETATQQEPLRRTDNRKSACPPPPPPFPRPFGCLPNQAWKQPRLCADVAVAKTPKLADGATFPPSQR